MKTDYLAGLNKVKANCPEVSIQRYPGGADYGPFVKVVGCNINGGLMYHMEIPEAEYDQIIDSEQRAGHGIKPNGKN